MKITIEKFKEDICKIQNEFRAKYPAAVGVNFIFTDIETGRTAILWNDFFGLGFDIFWLPTLNSAKKKSQSIAVSYNNMDEEIEVEGNIYNFKGRKMEMKISLTFNLEN